MTSLALSAFTATSSLGAGLPATLRALRERRPGLTPCTFETARLPTWIGEVPDVDAHGLPAPLRQFDCRNNRLALLGLAQDGFDAAVRAAAARHGAARVGLYLGTSTSGILETELAYRRRQPDSGALPADFNYRGAHSTYSVAAFVRTHLALAGPATVISSACSSSAKVFAAAQRAIAAGLIDAAVVGGVDSLCLTTLYGFHSLQLTAPQPCRPFDRARDGISIGEVAAFALLERAGPDTAPGTILLLGCGESSDAYHMSSPQPQGEGAAAAMRTALAAAGLVPADIDYVNFHGTGTAGNDSAEAQAIAAVLGTRVPGSSTKGATGHTLGAAGALEAVICALALRHDFMPGGLNTREIDPLLQVNYLLDNRKARLRHVLSNSFGFGGSNCSLVLGRALS